MIQGAPKGGKSCFALYLALVAATGGWQQGRFSARAAHSVLYCAYEDGETRLRRRIESYCRGLGLGAIPPNLHAAIAPPIRLCRNAEPEVRRAIHNGGYRLIVFDTLSYIHLAENENSARDMAAPMEELRRITTEENIAVLVVHHSRKPGAAGDMAGASERGRGSSVIPAACDMILDWGSRPVPNRTNCYLASKEAGHGLEFAVDYHDDEATPGTETVTWEIGDIVEREDRLITRAKVLAAAEALSRQTGDGVKAAQVAEAARLDKNTARDHLKALEREGRLTVQRVGQSLVYEAPK